VTTAFHEGATISKITKTFFFEKTFFVSFVLFESS